VLPIAYFHLVFTLPHELNGWVQLHPDDIYRLFFSAVWDTLRCFGQDPRRLNGQIGMTAVLHTWGQNLSRHVHLHCLIPGGALSTDKRQWKTVKSTYLFPIRALSRCFRGKMVSCLRKAYTAKSLCRIDSAQQVDEVLIRLMSKDWVVYARHTCQHAGAVVNYLSQYTYRIAISNQRLLTMDDEQVQFSWKDYAANCARKIMSLTGVEFIRRFLQHVFPAGFMRIRHYGFLANCHRRAKLALIRELLQTEVVPEQTEANVRTVVPPLLSSAIALPGIAQNVLVDRCA
jgi:Putative transposase